MLLLGGRGNLHQYSQVFLPRLFVRHRSEPGDVGSGWYFGQRLVIEMAFDAVLKKKTRQTSLANCDSFGLKREKKTHWAHQELIKKVEVDMDVSDIVPYPQLIHFNRVFHYKRSILGYLYPDFRKKSTGDKIQIDSVQSCPPLMLT